LRWNFVTAQEWVLTGNGAILKYEAGQDVQRMVWISARARAKHTEISDIIERVCSRFDSKWRLLVNKEDYENTHRKAIKSKRTTNVIALKTSTENLETLLACLVLVH
jgi:hypothetical protein